MAGRWTNYGEERICNSIALSQVWVCQLFKLPTTDADDEDFTGTEADYDGYGAQGFSFATAADTGSAGTWYAVSTSNLVWTHSGDGVEDTDNTIYGYTIYGEGGVGDPFYYEFFASPVSMTAGAQISFVPKITLIGLEDVV